MSTRKAGPYTPGTDDEAIEAAHAEYVKNQGADVAVRDSGTAVAVRKGDTGIFGRLLSAADRPDETSDDVHRQILEEILSRTTYEDILAAPESVPAVDMIGVPLRVLGFKLQESEFEEGAPAYSVMRATVLETGEPIVVTCGWQALSVQLQAAAQADEVMIAKAEGRDPVYGLVWRWAFVNPFHCKMYQLRRPNKHNKYPLRLIALPKE